jgi:hypothetical protein
MGLYSAYGTKRDRGKPRKYRTDNTCKAKPRYVSEVEARANALLSLETRRDTDRIWVYRCRHCSGWHLTSSNQGKRYMVRLEVAA